MAVAKRARTITSDAVENHFFMRSEYNLLREKAVSLATDDVANRRVLILEKQED